MTESTLPECLKLNKASGFPEGWRALCDDLAARVAKDLKQFRPTAVSILVAHSRRRMVIRVFIRPRATAEVLKRVKAITREFAAWAAATPRKIVAEVSSTAIQNGRESPFSAALDHAVRAAECRQQLLDADADADADATEFDLVAADTQASPAKLVQVFSSLQARELPSNLGLIGDSDSRARVKHALAKGAHSGGRRQVIQPPDLESEPVRRLQEHLPNFRQVLAQAVLPHIALPLAIANARLVPTVLTKSFPPPTCLSPPCKRGA